MQETSAEPPRRGCTPTWARLIAKVYHVDPLVCTRCGRKMQMIAFLTDELSIRRILDHLGLSAPVQDKPPPVREILRVAEQGESWGVGSRPSPTLKPPSGGSHQPPRSPAPAARERKTLLVLVGWVSHPKMARDQLEEECGP
jgi:hypothetical protein